MARPQVGDYGSFYQTYINYTTENSIDALINAYSTAIEQFVLALPNEKASYAYANNKWTIKQVIQHMIDTERIFTYRAVCIARGETNNLPGFDENAYAASATAAHRSLESLQQEFIAVRKSTDILLSTFTNEALQKVGIASNNSITCNAICYIIFGHNLHHKKVLEERYL